MSKDDDHYLTVGALRRVLAELPDDSRVFYERIEDVYFKKHGWKPDKLIRTDHTEPEDNLNDEYIRAFCAFEHDSDVHITAHY